ncbi:MAG: LicD family protein [Synergistaceae bacterium]|nr:LicD family protein [Synergistaceae bacterium]
MNIKLEIPESFYQGEEKCGYYVSPEMKKVWAVQLDLLNEFARVCEKYNLRWFINWGTLLGAVRHKGFIPWDDDMDVSMMREDYERFLDVADKEFHYPYHLRTRRNDKERMQNYAKLHNEDTTFFEPNEASQLRAGKKINYSQGIYIDIFQLFDAPDDEQEFRKFFGDIRFLEKIAGSFYHIEEVYTPAPKLWKRFIKFGLHSFLKLFRLHIYKKIWDKSADKIDACIYPDSKFVFHCNFLYPYEEFIKKFVFPRYFFDDTVLLPFEMMKLPAPSHYEELLQIQYGDWHKFLITYQHSHNYDAEHSYKYYTEEGHPLPETK